MTDEDQPDTLALNAADYVASAAKAALGAIPFAGSLLAELAGTVIPNQRIDRLVRFADELEQRLNNVQQEAVRAQLTNENFTDLMEEGLRQAARSTTNERRQHIASVIANSLKADDISFVESKHLLRLLGEINDIEVIWLRYYLHTVAKDDEFRSRHNEVLTPVAATMTSPRSEIDKETLQGSYKQHLHQLGLLSERHRVDSKSGMPECDRASGRPKVIGYELTRLGRLMLRYLDCCEPEQAG